MKSELVQVLLRSNILSKFRCPNLQLIWVVFIRLYPVGYIDLKRQS